MLCLVEITFDALFRSLLEFFLMESDSRQTTIGRQQLVQVLAILLHHSLQFFITEVDDLVLIGVDKGNEFLTLLN